MQTKLYSKPSDTHCYLTPNSCHKTHIVENIPNNTARRVRQNNSEIENYHRDKIVYTNYLIARGYNEQFVNNAFEKVESLDRTSLYAEKVTGVKNKICLPLTIDTNPALPDMGKIINRHKHILNLDLNLARVIPSSSVFVSHRSTKNIKDLIISSKLHIGPVHSQPSINPTNKDEHNAIEPSLNVEHPIIDPNNVPGCVPCNKCYLCRHYLHVCDEFTSYHTEQVFKHKSRISCNSECIIYLADCVTHRKSYSGYTTTNMKLRFSNNKSHFKKNNASCEFVKHFMEHPHDIDFSSIKNYDQSLCKHVRVTLIEQVKVEPGDSKAQKEAKCEAREGFWQTQLKTLQSYGGLNKKDSRKYVTRRQQEKNR